MTDTQKASVVSALERGEIIAYPTDTIYGLGVNIYNESAIEKLIGLKGRDRDKPVSVLFADVERLLIEFSYLNSWQTAVVRRLLPGRITLILPVPAHHCFHPLFVKGGYIGVRVVDSPALNEILVRFGKPISTTSINPGGAPPAMNVAEINRYFNNRLAIILDDGPAKKQASTILKIRDHSYEILRSGSVSPEEIERILSTL